FYGEKMNETIKKIWMDFNAELKGFILRKVKDESIADDILQEVFLKIIDNQDKISETKNTQQYIYAIARNTTTDHFRDARKIRELKNEEVYFTEEEKTSLNTAIAECCIKPFIAQLPAKYQQALIKTEFENISQIDLAKQLNISYSGAKSRVQRGKEKLKELIVECCNFPSDKYGNLQPTDTKNCTC